MEATFPRKVRRAGAPARNTRRSACALACTYALRREGLERTRESAAAAHPQPVPHHTTLCTSLHTHVHLLSTPLTRSSACRQHMPRMHTTHLAHTDAHFHPGSRAASRSQQDCQQHTAEIMQHAAAHSSRRPSLHARARRDAGSAISFAAFVPQPAAAAASVVAAQQHNAVSSTAIAANQLMSAAVQSRFRSCTRSHVRVATPPSPHAKLLVAHQRSPPFRGLEPQTIAKTCKDTQRLANMCNDIQRLAKICKVNAKLNHEHTNTISNITIRNLYHM